MPYLIALAGLAAAVYFFVIRARNAAEVATEVLDMANDVRLAARRFGFRRGTNVHPVESIEDPNIAIVAVVVSMLELDSFPTQQQRDALIVHAQSELDIGKTDAEEMVVLGRWFQTECGGASPAVSRLARKLYKLSGTAAVTPLMGLLTKVMSAGEDPMSEHQIEALDDIKRALHIT